MRDPKGAGGFFKGVATLLRQLRPSPRTSRHAASGAGGVALAPDVMNQILEQRTNYKALERVLKARRELAAKLATLTSCSK